MSVNEGVTEIFKRGGQTLGRHKKTALGGIGGAGIATVVTVLWPFLHSIQGGISKNTSDIADLKTKVAVMESEMSTMQKEIDNQSKK